MNTDKQRIAIAEACGWKRVKEAFTFDGKPIIVGYIPDIAQDISKELPDYLNDLNAMHNAEKTLTRQQKSTYILHLVKMKFGEFQLPVGAMTFATAAQRAEAFLRTIGKWEES